MVSSARRYTREYQRLAHAGDVIFELPACRDEGVTNGDAGISMRAVHAWVVADDQLVIGNGQTHVDAELTPVAMVAVRSLHEHFAPHDACIDSFELFDPVSDPRVQALCWLDTAVRDFQRHLHATTTLHGARQRHGARC